MNADNLEPFCPYAIDDHGECTDSFLPVAAAIVQQNDVAAVLVIDRARWKMCENIGGDFLVGAPGVIAPVVRIELVTYGDVSHLLCSFKWAHLIFRVGFLIDGIRWTE